MLGKSALQRAGELYADALDAYEHEIYTGGDGVGAYHYLGRVIHLVGDMGVPAHTLIDWHVNLPPFYTPDDYETFMLDPARFINHYQVQFGTLEELMRMVAEISNDYDSDNKDGENSTALGVDRSDGISGSECVIIRDACFPPAIRAAGGVLRMFYEEVKPAAIILSPSQGELCSGQGDGVAFLIMSESYNQTQHIDEIELEFSHQSAGPWSSVTTLPGAAGSFYTYDWSNALDDDQLWLKIQCHDTGDCDSSVSFQWIPIDSTSPAITNATY